MIDPNRGPIINPIQFAASTYPIYVSLSSENYVFIKATPAVKTNESAYPWKNLMAQLIVKNNCHLSSPIKDKLPKAVVVKKRIIIPISIEYFLPIF